MAKIKLTFEERKKNEVYTVFCDMDGVLTNLHKRFFEIVNKKYSKDFPKKDFKSGWDWEKEYGTGSFWKIVNKAGVDFWENLEWTIYGKTLWAFLNHTFKNVIILSSPSESVDSGIGKVKWIHREIGSLCPTCLVKEKWKLATPTNVLIDDHDENLISWEDHGGIAIKYDENKVETINNVFHYLEFLSYKETDVISRSKTRKI